MEDVLLSKTIAFVVASLVITLLPASPFSQFNNLIASFPALGYIAYFVPIPQIISILQAWLLAITTYYGYMLVMRYIKLIK